MGTMDKRMIPYLTSTTTQTTYLLSCDSTTNSISEWSNYADDIITFLAEARKWIDEIPILLKEKLKFDRIMKMRNTDCQSMKYSTWKPPQMYCGRDNIGTRN